MVFSNLTLYDILSSLLLTNKQRNILYNIWTTNFDIPFHDSDDITIIFVQDDINESFLPADYQAVLDYREKDIVADIVASCLHCMDIISHYRSYRNNMKEYYDQEVIRSQIVLNRSSRPQLPTIQPHVKEMENALDMNQQTLDIILDERIVSVLLSPYVQKLDISATWDIYRALVPQARPNTHSKIRAIQPQIFREWSYEGLAERRSDYGPILQTVLTQSPPCVDFAPDMLHHAAGEKIRSNTVNQPLCTFQRLFNSLSLQYSQLMPILNTIRDRSVSQSSSYSPRVLVPGCGLGRLPFELSLLGYDVVANELSPAMLIPFIYLKSIHRIETSSSCDILPDLLLLRPWVHVTSQWFQSSDRYQTISFPDIPMNPSDIRRIIQSYDPFQATPTAGDETVPKRSKHNSSTTTISIPPYLSIEPHHYETIRALQSMGTLSLVDGTFEQSFSQECYYGTFDVIITCFFIDTGDNIIDYISLISKLLKSGGIWCNFGPLLYHFADDDQHPSLQLSWDDIETILPQYNLVLDSPVSIRTSLYGSPPRSLGPTQYNSIQSLARKM